ncbi:MAG: hypothetical protein QXW71_01040 [Thermoplasmata archaeon]
MVNKSEQKPEQKTEEQEEIEKYDIETIEIIKEKPLITLIYKDYGEEEYYPVYSYELKTMKPTQYIGDLRNAEISQRLTKIEEIKQGSLFMLETKKAILNGYKINRKFIIFDLH